MKRVYDYAIIGGGVGGLALTSLLLKDGFSVCLIEANTKLGGHAYNLQKGKYNFCHDVQYLMGCQPGGPTHTFLKKIGLDSKIKFNKLDSKKYDLISIKNIKVEIPLGIDNYKRVLCEHFPEEQDKIIEFIDLEKKIWKELDGYHKIVKPSDLLIKPWKYLTVLRYLNKSLKQVFESFGFSKELQAILAGRIGNLSASPSEVSFILYSAMDVAFSDSAYFPRKGMYHMINSIQEYIDSFENSRIILNQKVTKIINENQLITEIITDKGESVKAKKFISNIDPHQTLKLLSNKIKYNHKVFDYDYSDSIFCIYLGLKNIDLKKAGFKKQNIWHHSTFDLDSEYWVEIKTDDFRHPWLFISVPSLYADPGALCPKGNHTFEILTFVNYKHFRKLYDTNKNEYNKFVQKIYNQIIKIVDENYLRNIEEYIDEKVIHTPIDMEEILNCPKGNVYGRRLTFKNLNLNKITHKSPLKNMYFVGQNQSINGIMSVIVGAMDLHEKLRKK